MIPILLYHRIDNVTPVQDPDGLTVSPEQFEMQMRYLADEGFHCLSLKEAFTCLHLNQAAPPRSFTITFDDGYQDNYDNAWPILQKYDFTATIFLVAERIGHMTDWAGQSNERAAPLMPLKNVLEMQEAGIEFGSHTLTHASLTDLPLTQAQHEIKRSRQMLSEMLDRPIDFFCYPYSRFNQDVMDVVAEEGYLGACGETYMPAGPYNMWRMECFGYDTMRQFQRKLTPSHLRFVKFRDQSFVGKMLRKIKRAVSQDN